LKPCVRRASFNRGAPAGGRGWRRTTLTALHAQHGRQHGRKPCACARMSYRSHLYWICCSAALHSGNPSHGDCAPHLARRSRRAIAQVASSGARQARSISPISRWQLVLDTQIMRDLATASLQLCAERLSFSGEAACVLDTSNAVVARNPSMEICEMPKLCSLPTVYSRISARQSKTTPAPRTSCRSLPFLIGTQMVSDPLIVHRRLAELSFRIPAEFEALFGPNC